jgi:hypothetical protein
VKNRDKCKRSSSLCTENAEGKTKQAFLLTRITANGSKAVLQHSAIQIFAHHIADYSPPLAIMLLKAMIVLTHEPFEMVK